MRVFIADDSILIRNIVKELLATDPGILVVGEATNGADAAERVLNLQPDIVIMDVDMPIMNGLESTRLIVASSTIPVLIFTHNTEPELPFKALRLGAVDFLLKPDFSDVNKPEYVISFIDRLKALSRRSNAGKNLAGKPAAMKGADFSAAPAPRQTVAANRAATRLPVFEGTQRSTQTSAPQSVNQSGLPRASVIVVGASTGGPQAVSRLLANLRKPFPLPIVIVQHIETGFDKGYAEWLTSETGQRVVLATDGEEPGPGTVYVAPTDRHLKFANAHFVLDDGPKVLNQKPSVDTMFASAARQYGEQTLGVLLTGMGTDGADGCAAILAAGGYTVVQDEASSLIYGMPRAAVNRGAASRILALDAIGPFVDSVAGRPG